MTTPKGRQTPADGSQGVKDRVIDFRRVRASELIPSPLNWREHPPAQRAALRALLAEVGFAGAILARKTPAGLQVIDGHLRAEELGDQEVPVLVLDVNEEEAKTLLLTLDPLATMAGKRQERLDALLKEVDAGNPALQELLEKLGKAPQPGELPDASPQLGKIEYRIVVECRTEKEQAKLLRRFEKEGLPCRALIS